MAERKEDFRDEHPRTADLVIEISISSHDYDRSKLRAYAAAGVKECWLVLAPEKSIEVYRQPGDGSYGEHVVYGPGGTVGSVTLPAFSVVLEALFSK